MTTSNEDLAVRIAEIRTMLAERQGQVNESMGRFERTIESFRVEIKGNLDDHRSETEKKLTEVTIKLSKLESDGREVRDTMLLTKGGWKVLVALGALAATVGAFLTKIPWSKVFGQ